MENLYIPGSNDVYFVPTVDFNAETGICELSGESYLEETVKFYQPLLEWLKQYITEVRRPITFNIKLTYYNTSSSRSILDILDILKIYEDEGGFVTVNRYYEKDEEEVIQEEVEDYEIESDLKIQMLPFEDGKK